MIEEDASLVAIDEALVAIDASSQAIDDAPVAIDGEPLERIASLAAPRCALAGTDGGGPFHR
jgi:hypothetical protein